VLRQRDAASSIEPLLIVRNADGEVLFRTTRLESSEPNIGAQTALMHAAMQPDSAVQFFTVRLKQTGLVRFICLRLAQPTGTYLPTAAYLQVGLPLGDIDLLLDVVIVASVVLIPVVILLTSLGGLGIAKRALAPIDQMGSTLESIEATDLSRRVDAGASDAEVARLSTSINRLLDRLQRSFLSLKEFTIDVSHQLQTPLTVMKSAIDVASHDRERHADDARTFEDLSHELDALAATLQDLRDYSLAEADSSSARSAPIDASGVFEEGADVVRALAEAHGITCATHISPGLAVWGNAVRLRQVVLNLGENAVQFTPAGGHIRIRAASLDHSTVLLSIEDTGSGIPAEALPHVFERGYKVPGSGGSGVRSRSGLGLAIVKRVVDAHGGSVQIKSARGEGTQVAVILPAASRHNQA
jgi:signal transduction histidine kinase